MLKSSNWLLKRFVVGCVLCLLLCLAWAPPAANAQPPGQEQLPVPVKEEQLPVPQGLPQEVEETFENNKYKIITLNEETPFYRYYGGQSGQKGLFMTPFFTNYRSKAISSLALNPLWGNNAMYRSIAKLPAGTKVAIGVVAGISKCLPGGEKQVYYPKNIGQNSNLFNLIDWSSKTPLKMDDLVCDDDD
ncbi:hypothetical protein [Okeania sp. SIO1F9]|uniref:hypothetical protein n=1 Tax=Okeania sp. SIO1F9 TaxID=2607813 RepID=UPI00144C353F|nr:hypothetical protein [Okeania sp. SIO1F9]NET75608.1 hypothetical protein [Okeania sp. SIO1F9]